MNEYVSLLGRVTIGIDTALLLLMGFCIYRNGCKLFNNDEPGDKSFRFILFCMCIAFIYANIKSVERHLQTFIYDPMSQIDIGIVRSLLEDRGFMFVTAICILLLTRKYHMKWYRNN